MPLTIDSGEVEFGAGLSPAKRALLLERLRLRMGGADAVKRIQPRTPGAVVPISAEQRRIWLHSETNAGVPLYNEAVTIHRLGEFSLATMTRVFNEILRRHEAWRTSFDVVDGELVQVIHPHLHVQLPLVDLADFPLAEREAECLRLATEDAALPIELHAAPLFRARIVRMAADDHRIHLTLHHLIFDGVSIYRILMPEVAALYQAFSEGQGSPLPEPSLQYGDYALWRREHAASATVMENLEYWKAELAGPLPVLDLPSDRPRPAQQSHRGSMECFRLPLSLLRALRSVSQSHGVTLYMTLLAAFKVLLFRYSGQQDLIVGGATDARRRPELEGLMGYFLDTFAIRSRPSPDQRFSDFLAAIRNSVLGALARVDVPFDAVVQAVEPQRTSSHHPVFQAFFSIEPPVAPFAEGWDLTQMDVTVGASKFDLYLELDERPDHMAARFMYSTDLFDGGTIRRMAQHWLVILEAVSQTPECALGELPLLTVAERTDLFRWNATQRDVPACTALELIVSQAERTPTAKAAVFENLTVTYEELMARSALLAAQLRSAGVERGSLVALCLPRSIDLLAGILGIWRTGAAYLPLDPDLPEARIQLGLTEAGPSAVLVEQPLKFDVPEGIRQVITAEVKGGGSDVDDVPSSSDDLAYVIQTSGTTGRPKAVEIRHASLVNLLLSMQRRPGFASDILLAVTTISFDIAALELLLPLISGGTVCIASRQVARDPQLLPAAIETSGCTVIQATPSTWALLIASGWRGASRPLKILCGGEALTAELAGSLLSTGADLWNVYGPTETTIWSTVHQIEQPGTQIAIGCPIDNTTAYILDSQQQLLPVGVPGKLYLGGAGLARGYRSAPELTAERFIHPPVAGGERLYDTGDLATRRTDGSILCLGRTDHQVKVRGFRVELEAVEAAARRHPRVAAAAARIFQHSTGTRLAVYLVGKDGPPPDAHTLRCYLQTDQPEYMIPSDVVALDRLPLTPNGKLDRASLPAPHSRPPIREAAPLRTELQVRLAALWSEVLGVEDVGNRDNFFDLGGHSLLVAKLQQKVFATFGRRLSMAALFHAPTLQQQASLLEDAANAASVGLVPLQPRGAYPRLFWLHPPPLLGHLASALGEDQPLLGVGLTETDAASLKASPDIQSIAERHVRTILAAQSSGPFYLAGLCTGGIVAFEAASQLRAAGYDVPLLILLDAQNPEYYQRIGSLSLELNKLAFYIRQGLRDAGDTGRATLLDRLLYRARQVWHPSVVRDEVVVGEHLTDSAAYRYRPPQYAGDVLLIQPTDRPSKVDHLKGWKSVIEGRLFTQDVKGHHDELLNLRNVAGVAKVISSYLPTAKTGS